MFIKRYTIWLLVCSAALFCIPTFCEVEATDADQINRDTTPFTQPMKLWTMFTYMASDNNLYPFAQRNLAQMMQVGSNEYLNILVLLDTHLPGQNKTTRFLYIEKGKIMQIGPDYALNTGDPQTLIDAVQWAHTNFPSHHLAINLWNHGSGDLNPIMQKAINPSQLFRYDAAQDIIALDRSIGFIDFLDKLHEEEELCNELSKRGVCFDDTNHSYLDDQKLMRAFDEIVALRNGKKIDLLMFDSCLMAGTGTAWIASQFADYMNASEEVILGPGYDYRKVFEPLAKEQSLQPEQLALHIVNAYYQTYDKVTRDYTHAAFKLSEYALVCDGLDELSKLLIEALNNQKNQSVKTAIMQSSSHYNCTYFDEPTFKDLYHFCSNLLNKIDTIILKTPQETTSTIAKIKVALQKIMDGIKKTIIANVVGKNLSGAHGISIYLPDRKMTSPSYLSYNNTEFAKNNSWREFLAALL